jgi:hypothetical protein
MFFFYYNYIYILIHNWFFFHSFDLLTASSILLVELRCLLWQLLLENLKAALKLIIYLFFVCCVIVYICIIMPLIHLSDRFLINLPFKSKGRKRSNVISNRKQKYFVIIFIKACLLHTFYLHILLIMHLWNLKWIFIIRFKENPKEKGIKAAYPSRGRLQKKVIFLMKKMRVRLSTNSSKLYGLHLADWPRNV